MIDLDVARKIHGWFHYRDLYAYMVRTARQGARFVEIGAWEGKSTYYMGGLLANYKRKDIKFWTIDTWKGSEEHKDDEIMKDDGLYKAFVKNIEPVKEFVTPIRSDSSEAASLFEDESLDFVLLDGDHSMVGARKDVDAWWPKVKMDGVMAGDDFTWKGVHRAVTKTFPFAYVWAEGDSKSIMWLVKKGGPICPWIDPLNREEVPIVDEDPEKEDEKSKSKV